MVKRKPKTAAPSAAAILSANGFATTARRPSAVKRKAAAAKKAPAKKAKAAAGKKAATKKAPPTKSAKTVSPLAKASKAHAVALRKVSAAERALEKARGVEVKAAARLAKASAKKAA